MELINKRYFRFHQRKNLVQRLLQTLLLSDLIGHRERQPNNRRTRSGFLLDKEEKPLYITA